MSDYTMKFGKFKGQRLQDIDKQYLYWLHQELSELIPELESALKEAESEEERLKARLAEMEAKLNKIGRK
ncbi:MAG: DUF3820 family protein [Planctomycetota bacterium]